MGTTINNHDTVGQLTAKIKNSKDEGQKTKLRAILRLKEGSTGAVVAKNFLVSERSVRIWVTYYNARGSDALKTDLGGRPHGNPKWDVSIFEDLGKEIEKGGKYWSVPLMVEWIKKKYQKDIPKNTVWYHVTDLDYSYKSARPHPYKGDQDRQDAFKKGALHRS